MNSTICQAIREMKLLHFTYADAQGNVHTRLVEPYVHGLTKQGNEALRGYQVWGPSETTIPGWKLFLVERMAVLRMVDENFHGTAPGYAHGDKARSPLHCRVP